MTREDLKKLGLEAEAIDKIMGLNGEAIEEAKQKISTLTLEITGLEAEKAANVKLMLEANAKIKSFEGMDIDKIKLEAEKWKADYETLEESKKTELDGIRFDNAFEKALAGVGAKNYKAVAALFDKEKISLDGENLLGFDEQFKIIKPENEYLFEDGKPKPKFVIPTGGGAPPTTKTWGELSFDEKILLKKESPEEYKQLKGER